MNDTKAVARSQATNSPAVTLTGLETLPELETGIYIETTCAARLPEKTGDPGGN